MAHIHNGILLSHKKEHIWVSSDEADEPRILWAQANKNPDKKVEKETPPPNEKCFSVTFQKTWIQRKLQLGPSQQTGIISVQ